MSKCDSTGGLLARELNLSDIVQKLDRAIATGNVASQNARQALDFLVGPSPVTDGNETNAPEPSALLYVLSIRADELQSLLENLRQLTAQFRDRLQELPPKSAETYQQQMTMPATYPGVPGDIAYNHPLGRDLQNAAPRRR